MRKLIFPFLICIPAFIVFLWLHWPDQGSPSAVWWDHYLSYGGAGSDETLNPFFRIETLRGGWGTFWRDAWACWGLIWILALFAWPRSRLLWKVMFVALFIGCFSAAMVSHDKGRLWIRMGVVLLPMIVEWIETRRMVIQRIAVDPAIPEDEIHLRYGDKTVGKITNLVKDETFKEDIDV